jgi:catechol 2,3-dioxygenase-like lactoylglutathione lyase family enzyme
VVSRTRLGCIYDPDGDALTDNTYVDDGYFGALGGGGVMAVTGLANLAIKVTDLDAACDFYLNAGASVRDRMTWGNGERADVYLGPVMLTLFTRAIYEDAVDLPEEGFLHPALFTDDLDTELRGHRVLWGPAVVEGAFGKRRIAFVEAPGGIRLEFMEQLEEGS